MKVGDWGFFGDEGDLPPDHPEYDSYGEAAFTLRLSRTRKGGK